MVSEYRYNALGYRIAWHYDVTSASSPFGPDGSVNDTDPWYFFAYNERWQKWGVIRGTSSSGAITLDANPKEIFVHHKAGAGGFGGSSYIDSVLLRERDTTPEWRQAADSTRDETLYYVQNWRADVIGLASSQGGLVDHVRYSPYGVPTRVNPADIADDAGNALSSSSGANGGVTEGDYNYFMNEFLSNGAGADIASGAGEIFPGGDGAVNEGDYILFFNEYFVTYARGQLTADAVANRLGYAGYEFDPVLIGSGSGAAASDPTCFYHVRHRVYDSQNGRWTRRDPLGYVDGMGLYEYCRGMTFVLSDASGLWTPTPMLPGGPSPTMSPLDELLRRRPASYPLRDPTFDELMKRPFTPGGTQPVPSPSTPKPSRLPALSRCAGGVMWCLAVGEVFFCLGWEIGQSIPEEKFNFPKAPPKVPKSLPDPDWCKSGSAKRMWDFIRLGIDEDCHQGSCSKQEPEDACRKEPYWARCIGWRLAEEDFAQLCPNFSAENRGKAGSNAADSIHVECRQICRNYLKYLKREHTR